MKKGIIWFRNDLRVHDNEALFMAAEECDELICLYCVDSRQFAETRFGFKKTGSHRAKFLIESLIDLKNSLSKLGGELIIRRGKPELIIPELVQDHHIDSVYFHEEATDEEIQVEIALQKELGEEKLEAFWGSTLFHFDDLPFGMENLPNVFTAFRKKVEKRSEVRKVFQKPPTIKPISGISSEDIPTLLDLGLIEVDQDERAVLVFQGGETAALQRLNHYIWETDRLASYKKTRNGMLGADYSSKFSPWLANGTLSPRQIYSEVRRYEEERKKNDSTYWLIFELIWRDYFRFSALHFGNKLFKKGSIQNSNRIWSYDEELLDAWVNGMTGIPFVDANMRELKATGFMSNRGRQNVASFLAQNLNLDWRMGAEYFEQQLIDYDPCSNYGNWAYNATVGHDPRNRYFNIEFQASRYDSKGKYIKTWIPELKDVPIEFLQNPHDLDDAVKSRIGLNPDFYPKPIIDLEKSYDRIKARG